MSAPQQDSLTLSFNFQSKNKIGISGKLCIVEGQFDSFYTLEGKKLKNSGSHKDLILSLVLP